MPVHWVLAWELQTCSIICATVSSYLLHNACTDKQSISTTCSTCPKHFTSHSSFAALRQEVNHLLASVDELSAKQLGDALTAYDVKSPDTKNDISAPFPFNLMFKTSIGPKGDQVGYLRPETAQGLFVNFRYSAVASVLPHFILCLARQDISIFPVLLLKTTICVSWIEELYVALASFLYTFSEYM